MEEILEITVYIILLMVLNSMRSYGPSARDKSHGIAHHSPAPVEDCWQVLGIKPTDDLEEIKRAYRRLIKEHHPDIAGHHSTLKCAEITEAYKEAISFHTHSRTTQPR